jgi:hypothetical protein
MNIQTQVSTERMQGGRTWRDIYISDVGYMKQAGMYDGRERNEQKSEPFKEHNNASISTHHLREYPPTRLPILHRAIHLANRVAAGWH